MPEISRPPMSTSPVTRGEELLRLFHDSPAECGLISPVEPEAVPSPFRDLLDHASHMTTAMQRYHGGPVALEVIAVCEPTGGRRYAREILLTGPSGKVVQFGIVRIDLDSVTDEVARRILARETPLGRILIESAMHRDIDAVQLLAVEPREILTELIGPAATFGRVAEIRLDGQPAIELLEIVAAGSLG